MKKFFIILITMLGVIPLVLTVSWSQSIFLKDGSIIEGKIITENDVNLTVKLKNKNIKLKRKNIIRTVYDNEYKSRVSIILMDGRKIKGHVVEEGKDYYILRKRLDSKRELKIAKKKINGILKSDDIIQKNDASIQPSDESSEFPGLAVWTHKKVYKPYEEIVVSFRSTPGGKHDWISLAKEGSPDSHYEAYYYVNRKNEGELFFKNGLPQGDYEVRVYLHWSKGSYKVSKRYSFKVK